MSKEDVILKNPTYEILNRNLVKTLISDGIAYSEYLKNILNVITSINNLYKRRLFLNAQYSETIKCKNDIRRNTIALREEEEKLIDYCLSLKNGYYYILYPHYIYDENLKKYIQVEGSGSTRINISLATLLLKQKLSV